MDLFQLRVLFYIVVIFIKVGTFKKMKEIFIRDDEMDCLKIDHSNRRIYILITYIK